MTEPNHATATEAPETEEAPAGVSWPPLPSEPATQTSATQTSAAQNSLGQDPAVSSLLERLGALPGRPVAGHGEVYAGLHDELLEALNEDVSGHENATGEASS
ncbi:MAG TPA: hypothetical protein VFE00_03040 [Arthrobacter sp.]|nr:hypothetical protein [Arthrobacter sp.]